MRFIAALLAGLLFGAGLTVSGMSNPQKVLNFLDVAAMRSGGWDPTLLCVFAGALPVMFLAYRLRGTTPWFGGAFEIPADGWIDRPLMIGSALFGIGWGLVGLCPGPAVVAIALADRQIMPSVLVFFSSLLAGVWLALLVDRVGSAPSARGKG
jgi:uncharacterized protein